MSVQILIISILAHFKSLLESIVGSSNNFFCIPGGAPIDRLRIPLNDLESFEKTLRQIVGDYYSLNTPISKLRVPIEELREYESILERILDKQKQTERISSKIK